MIHPTRFIGLDIHKEYLVASGVDHQRMSRHEWKWRARFKGNVLTLGGLMSRPYTATLICAQPKSDDTASWMKPAIH